jgi:hypothetical protein
MSILRILNGDIEILYEKITKIVSLRGFSFYDKATYVDDFLHYNKMCKETIDNKVFVYECKSKCRFTVIVNYNDKSIQITQLICD